MADIYTNREKSDEGNAENTSGQAFSNEDIYTIIERYLQNSPSIFSPNIVGKYLSISPNGDVKIGNYDSGNGIFWDQSESVLDIRGKVSVEYLTVEQNYIQVAFESLDSWVEFYKEGALANFSLTRPGMCRVDVGSTATNNRSVLGFEHGDGRAFSSNYDSFFQTTVNDDGERQQDIGIAMGAYDPFTTTESCFGIRYILADKKVYGFYVSDTNIVYTLELSTGTAYMDSSQIWRAEWQATTKKIKFYFNGTYKGELDTNSDVMTIDTDPVIAFGGKQKSTVGLDNWYSLWSNMYLYFNI